MVVRRVKAKMQDFDSSIKRSVMFDVFLSIGTPFVIGPDFMPYESDKIIIKTSSTLKPGFYNS